MTLQDVLDAVGATPERYGSGYWYKEDEPWCPLAVEILEGPGLLEADARRLAAELLGCPVRTITAFTDWWDTGHLVSRLILESEGYKVPPDSVRKARRKS